MLLSFVWVETDKGGFERRLGVSLGNGRDSVWCLVFMSSLILLFWLIKMEGVLCLSASAAADAESGCLGLPLRLAHPALVRPSWAASAGVLVSLAMGVVACVVVLPASGARVRGAWSCLGPQFGGQIE